MYEGNRQSCAFVLQAERFAEAEKAITRALPRGVELEMFPGQVFLGEVSGLGLRVFWSRLAVMF